MAAKGSGGDYTPNKKKTQGGKRYDWGDGKGRVHSRPKKNRGGGQPQRPQPVDPYSAPLPMPVLQRQAENAANYRYGPVLGQIEQRQGQVAPWFDEYRARLLQPAQVQQQYQPVIQNQQQAQAETGKTLGLQGPAGEQDALAAKAREALTGLGLAALQANQQADTTYYQGRQGVSQVAQMGMQNQLGQQLQDTLGERGAYRNDTLRQLIGDERQYGLGLQHQQVENKAFGLDAAKAAGINPITGKPLPPKDKKDVITSGAFEGYTKGQVRAMSPAKKAKIRASSGEGAKVNKYGYTNEQWARFSPSHRQRIMRQQSASGGSSKPRFTPQQQATANSKLRSAVSLVQQGRKLPSGGAPEYWRQAFDQLVKDGMDPAIARAAVQLVRGGKVGPRTRRTLKDDYGITRYPKGSRRKKPPGSSSGGGGGPHGTGRLSAYNPDTDPNVVGKAIRRRAKRARKEWWESHIEGPSRRRIA